MRYPSEALQRNMYFDLVACIDHTLCIIPIKAKFFFNVYDTDTLDQLTSVSLIKHCYLLISYTRGAPCSSVQDVTV
jgi:hypothetical protein